MTVKELIKKLRTFDPETNVVVGGFDEEGYANIGCVEMVLAVPRTRQIEILGEYAKATADDKLVHELLLIDHN